jgi:hypothetical protein
VRRRSLELPPRRREVRCAQIARAVRAGQELDELTGVKLKRLDDRIADHDAVRLEASYCVVDFTRLQVRRQGAEHLDLVQDVLRMLAIVFGIHT